MKPRLLTVLLATLGLLSCIKDKDKFPPLMGDDLTLQLRIFAPSDRAGTRAFSTTDESYLDPTLQTIQVLAFYRDDGGDYRYGYTAEKVNKTITGAIHTIEVKALGLLAEQKFVVLANVSDSELAACHIINNEKFETAVAKLIDVGHAEWPAYNNSGSVHKYIPMYAVTTPPKVISSSGVIPSSTSAFPLIRMVARIDIQVHEDIPVSDFSLESAWLFNYQTAGYISYEKSLMTDTPSPPLHATVAAVPPAYFNTGVPILGDNDESPGSVIWHHSDRSWAGSNGQGRFVRQIYTYEAPEYYEVDRHKGFAVVVGGFFDGSSTETYYRINMKAKGDGSTRLSGHILRNYCYDVVIQGVRGPGASTPLEAYLGTSSLVVEVMEWNTTPSNIPIEKDYFLHVDKDWLTVPARQDSYTVQVTTDYPDPLAPVWSTAAGASWIHPVRNGNILEITVNANTTGTTRVSEVEVMAAHITKIIHVAQAPVADVPDIVPAGVTPFVGAFWRANETGERLINIRNMGSANYGTSWSAIVAEYDARWHPFSGDGIVMDLTMDSDSGVTFAPGESPGNPEDHPLPAKSYGYVSGTLSSAHPDISFRIGLERPFSAFNPKGDYSATFPARYAVVVVCYGSNPVKTMRIFVRHGEGIDYVMRPEDGGTNVPAGRPEAVRFLPYNLTATAFNSVALDVHGGRLTDYPSQAGALFQWANTGNRTRYAWDPYTPASFPIWENVGTTAFWTGDLSYTHETCPAGYRRPHDGTTTAVNSTGLVAGSEWRQSLWRHPTAGNLASGIDPNAVWGYYADGFFDRRQIVSGPGNGGSGFGSAAAVSAGNAQVAYVGGLYYNPLNWASLFFPAAGNRANVSSGALNSAGAEGHYWSGSVQEHPVGAPQNNRVWTMTVSKTTGVGSHAHGSVHTGISIRCVKDTPTPLTFSGWLYVKQGAGGEGYSWSDPLSSLTAALTQATAMEGAGFTLHGILVAGGSGNMYAGSHVVGAGRRVFGGWEGIPGTELPNNAAAPYTSPHRDLARFKANLLPAASGSTVAAVQGAGAALDGFVVQSCSNAIALVVGGGAYIHGVEVKNNHSLGAVLEVSGSSTRAVNVLVADNNGNVTISSGATMVNGTVANNTGAVAVSGATLLNSVVWRNGSINLTGSNTVQFCAFPDGSVPAGTGNIPIHVATNTAWFTSGNVSPGPHFNMNASGSKPYYAALSDRSPMLGRGDESSFNTQTPFLPPTARTDIDGNPRHYLGTDIGCYEDAYFEGFKLRWATDRVYISSKAGYASDIPLLLPDNEITQIGVDWSVTVQGTLNYATFNGPSTGSGSGILVGNIHITPNAPDYTANSERLCGTLLIHTNLGAYLPDVNVQVYQTPGQSAVWTNGYVGSFHRNNEVVARYISGTNSGAWSARIIAGLEWIKIDSLSKFEGVDITSEPNPPGTGGGYKKGVQGKFNGVVTGNGDIAFRVGMQSTLPAGAPPRYGLIVITRTTGVAMFFVRQGEEADYLYRPTDTYVPNGLIQLPRTDAVKFSTFNLRDPLDRTNNGGNALGQHGATWVTHPSKIGNFFQWNRNTAYVRGGQTSVFSARYDIETSYSATREACPDGYALGTVGEWVMSCYQNVGVPLSGNSISPSGAEVLRNFVYGRLADGYYDQLAPDPVLPTTDAIGAIPNVAMKGILMVNHFNYASIFFPTAGVMPQGAPATTSDSGFAMYHTRSFILPGIANQHYQIHGTHWSGDDGTGLAHVGISCTQIHGDTPLQGGAGTGDMTYPHAAPVRCVKVP